ncbi:hypothetical protein [Vogesella oryzae]|uniref:aldose epimerase family protein n=1 Tax=Vogesella oryzae TaxID=1735285 RepID=UPI001582AAD1|nr:hypothetical protein [Vogesella oryzae]
MALLTLRRGALHVELLPQAGGSIARCYLHTATGPWHILRPAGAAAIASGNVDQMACFPMLPLCGRLRDGHFCLPDGNRQSLPPAWRAGHFLHGIGWRRPWQLLGHDDAQARLQLVAAVGPYRFTANQHIELGSAGLTLSLSIKNEAAQTLPYGIGLHPYFPRRSDTRLQAQIGGLWEADAAILPCRPSAAGELVRQLAAGLQPDDWPLDNTAYGWQQRVTINDGAHQLRLTAAGPASWLTAYFPPGQDFFCLEPCTQVPDFPNLAAYPPEQTGGHWLAPGETLSMQMMLALRDAGG